MELLITMQNYKTNEIIQFSNLDLIARTKFYTDKEYSIVSIVLNEVSE